MTSGRQTGFTIIETMLFLAVSGALAVGVLVSAGYAVNVQRYRDANVSLVSYLQGAYNSTVNVKNDRRASLACNTGAGISNGGAQTLGSSDCTIVGKLLRTADGLTFTSRSVFAERDRTTASNDLDALVEVALFVDDAHIEPEQYTLEWGTQVVRADGSPVAPLSILIVRSPLSGAVRTYTSNSTSVTPAFMVTGPSMSTDLPLCIEPSGLQVGERSGAIIYADTSSTSGVKQMAGGSC